ncbi:hypothetical protein ANCCEY_05898 [Ancylostoma ceylanicum]|uniref:Uncharacterized protein n=1 Tax=Ancylostoma ceylanicum TaxID=53326 RepID=A0A0D6LT23_9BILA|nr:hypothetical protein ANCCEY_05898 [Ancylostoma ceylanicum]
MKSAAEEADTVLGDVNMGVTDTAGNMRMNGGSSSSGGGGASGGGSSSASAGGSSAAAGSRSYSLMGSVPGGGSLSEMGSTPSGTGTVDIGGGSYMIGGGTDIMVSPIMVTTFIRGMDNDRDRGRGRGRGRGRDHEDNGNHFGQIARTRQCTQGILNPRLICALALAEDRQFEALDDWQPRYLFHQALPLLRAAHQPQQFQQEDLMVSVSSMIGKGGGGKGKDSKEDKGSKEKKGSGEKMGKMRRRRRSAPGFGRMMSFGKLE